MSVGAYIWGEYEVRVLQDAPISHNIESQMISADQLIQSVARGDTNFTSTMNLYYIKGVIQVDGNQNWVKYTGSLNANAYERLTQNANTTCNSSTTIIQDSITGIKMSRMHYTNVFRGSTGGQAGQLVEIVSCYDEFQINENALCKGKSGPRAQLSARKVGYNATDNKPIVEVLIC